MKKWIIATIMGFLLVGCSHVILEQVPMEQQNTTENTTLILANQGMLVYNKIKDSVVVVGTAHGGHGTGYFIEGGYILTCFHVIDGIEIGNVKIQLREDGGTYKTYHVEIVGVQIDKDIAVLKFSDAKHNKLAKPLKFRTGPVIVGLDLYNYGQPYMNTYYFTKGIVSKITPSFLMSYDGSLFDYKAFYTDSFMAPGNSGGVTVDSNGDIIGMTSAGVIESVYGMRGEVNIPLGINIAIHLDELVEYSQSIIEHPDLHLMPEPEVEVEVVIEEVVEEVIK